MVVVDCCAGWPLALAGPRGGPPVVCFGKREEGVSRGIKSRFDLESDCGAGGISSDSARTKCQSKSWQTKWPPRVVVSCFARFLPLLKQLAWLGLDTKILRPTKGRKEGNSARSAALGAPKRLERRPADARRRLSWRVYRFGRVPHECSLPVETGRWTHKWASQRFEVTAAEEERPCCGRSNDLFDRFMPCHSHTLGQNTRIQIVARRGGNPQHMASLEDPAATLHHW
jgi:hypothetical protein